MTGFAVIERVNDLSEVPVKFNVLRRAPGFIIEWYIRKFNPFTVEKLELLGEAGLLVRLPVTGEQVPEYFGEIAERTLRSLQDYGVGFVLPPAGLESEFPKILPLADGRRVFPFFIMPGILKTLGHLGKNIKNAEIVVIDGDPGLTMSLIDNIYPNVNYLTVITGQPEDYEHRAAEVFGDCGLNIQVTDYNRTSLSNADVVINTQADNRKYDYYYKRGAIYFDLAGGAMELRYKRGDMLITDGLRLSGAEGTMELPRFECGIYGMWREYRTLVHRGYDPRLARVMAERLGVMGYTLASLQLNGKPVTAAELIETRRRAGVGTM